MSVLLDVVFAALAALLYLCTVGVTAKPTYSDDEFEKQALVAVVGALVVFALVLWVRLA